LKPYAEEELPIGLMGGTFDPIHMGHIITAESIKKAFQLDLVYFIPCFLPPHKERDDIISAAHRYAMVVLATLDKADLVASPLEIDRRKRSYTIETIEMFKNNAASGEQIFFIAGIDSFLTIRTWKQWKKLLVSCHFIINSRPGFSFDELNTLLPGAFKKKIVDFRTKQGLSKALWENETRLKEGPLIFLCDTPPVDISATTIRKKIKRGEDCKGMLPNTVLKYIRKHKLYYN
jgi:nicotinate-nucleotide adenylyltransferase